LRVLKPSRRRAVRPRVPGAPAPLLERLKLPERNSSHSRFGSASSKVHRASMPRRAPLLGDPAVFRPMPSSAALPKENRFRQRRAKLGEAEPVSSSLELGSEDPCPREKDAGINQEQGFQLPSTVDSAPSEEEASTMALSRLSPYSERWTRRHQSLQHPDPKGSWRLRLRRAIKPRAREQKTFEPQDLSAPRSRKTSALRAPESRRAFRKQIRFPSPSQHPRATRKPLQSAGQH